MNELKKSVLVSGTVNFPLTVGNRAVIFQNNGGTRYTSIIQAINQVSNGFIAFETENTFYRVKQPNASSQKAAAFAA